MPILEISENVEVYQEITERLISPYSKIAEDMTVRLCAQTIHNAFVENTRKKPIVLFYTQTEGKEIPKNDWTHEMKQVAEHFAVMNPVPYSGKRYSLLGKIWISTAVLGIISAFALVFYLSVFKAPQDNLSREAFVALPQEGDKFYGSINQLAGMKSNTEYAWIKILTVNPKDSTCTYAISDNPGSLNFNTLEEEHNSFSSVLLTGKFQSNKEKGKITIVSKDKNTRFECLVINNEFNIYKISVN